MNKLKVQSSKFKAQGSTLVFTLFVLVAIASCSKKDAQTDLDRMQKADLLVEEYEEHHDSTVLEQAAKLYAEVTDSAYIKDAVGRELASLMELNRNDEAIEYIEKLDDACFEKSYQKKLNLCVFQARKLKDEGKDAESRAKYDEGVAEVKRYCDKTHDESALYEMLMVELQYKSRTEILDELKNLLDEGKYSKTLIEELIHRVEQEQNVSLA